MATALEQQGTTMECGFCLEQGSQLVDPRVLPCHHTHCYPCLVRSFETSRLVKCGHCKGVFDVTLTRLPSAIKEEEHQQYCQTCSESGEGNQPAISYCHDCNRKMCSEHLELHNRFLPLHKDVLKIEDYRSCSKHDDKPITMGCSRCFKVLCTTCRGDLNGCVDDSVHSSTSLEELVKLLKAKRDQVKVEAQIKEGELSKLLKRSTRVLSDYERKTEELVGLLHSTRDEQLSELNRKYDELETELVESRRRSKEQLVHYMEEKIGVRLTEMNTLLLLQDSRFKESHQVDIARSFSSLTTELRRFIEEDLPHLTLLNQRTLSHQVSEREIELKMVDTVDIPVSRLPPPTSLRLKNVLDNIGSCYSVSHHDGFTFVESGGTAITKIEGSSGSTTSLPPVDGEYIDGLSVYNEKLYILTDPAKVHVTDLNGKHVTSWVHSESHDSNVNKLVVTGDKVVVPDRSNKRLTVYSLDGQIIKHVTCPQDGEWGVMALCAPAKESVVVSSHDTSTVFRVNIETGEVVWTCTAVTKPGGVACYKEEYLLVTSRESGQTEIHLLEADTGKHLGKLLETDERPASEVYDLCVTGDTLIVPRYEPLELLYYQLMSE